MQIVNIRLRGLNGLWRYDMECNNHALSDQGMKKESDERLKIIALLHALYKLKKPCLMIVHDNSEHITKVINDWHEYWIAKGEGFENKDLWDHIYGFKAKHTIRVRND